MESPVDRGLGKVLGVIPARLESQRLPRKVLRPICGRPMIAWVYERARLASCLDSLLVATDAEEIYAYCRHRNISVVMTSPAHLSGTDRVVEVVRRELASGEAAGIFVNIQGDEPMITAGHIELLLRPFRESAETQVSTLKVSMERDQALDPNNVKVVTDSRGQALYFSRALIPHDRGGSGQVRYYKHLGLYAYTAAALEKYRAQPPSVLEQHEQLEQLRFLESGIPITVVETSEDTVGVDTEEDLRRVEEYFRQSEAVLPEPEGAEESEGTKR